MAKVSGYFANTHSEGLILTEASGRQWGQEKFGRKCSDMSKPPAWLLLSHSSPAPSKTGPGDALTDWGSGMNESHQAASGERDSQSLGLSPLWF